MVGLNQCPGWRPEGGVGLVRGRTDEICKSVLISLANWPGGVTRLLMNNEVFA